jgi:hypothetical protein
LDRNGQLVATRFNPHIPSTLPGGVQSHARAGVEPTRKRRGLCAPAAQPRGSAAHQLELIMISGPLASRLGTILCRIVVPIWILTGAVFKLVEADANNLPRGVLQLVHNAGVTDLTLVLWVLVSLECFAVSVMLFLPRVARLMATFMLGCFCLILINEIRLGNFSSCGCFGSVPIPPWAILIVDGALLAGVVLLNGRSSTKPLIPVAPLGGVLAFTAIFTVVGALRILGGPSSSPADGGSGNANGNPAPATDGGAARASGPGATPPKTVWVDEAVVSKWLDQSWTSIELAKLMPRWPDPEFKGKWYVIFYSPTCDHCQALLEGNFELDAPAPTITVAVPEGKTAYSAGAYDRLFYCRECVTEMELPVGPTWVVDFPLVVAIEDNIVKCAKTRVEADHDNCLIWH